MYRPPFPRNILFGGSSTEHPSIRGDWNGQPKSFQSVKQSSEYFIDAKNMNEQNRKPSYINVL